MKNMGEVFQLSQGCSAAVRHGAPCGSFYAEKAAAAVRRRERRFQDLKFMEVKNPNFTL